MDTATMNTKQESLLLVIFCGVLVLLSAGGIAWAVMSGMLLDIDGIMMVLTCLAVGGLFSLFLFLQLRSAMKSAPPKDQTASKPEGKSQAGN
ncbi:MAG TPA: hypothetical protein VGA40_04815 [Candidatus Acidoferrales bacterium]